MYDNGETIPFEYSSETDTITFTLSEGWHNVGFILCDAAGNANISQEINNIHIGNFWIISAATLFGVSATGLAVLLICGYKRKEKEMNDDV